MLTNRVYTKASPRGRWEEIPNGPFPVTPETLIAARAQFAEELARSGPLVGVRASPQTVARAILRELAPRLSSFDAAMLGFAVTSAYVKWEEEPE